MSSPDSRLVQTAVIGTPGSARAIILPTDADDLVRWRRRHPTYTYFCGTQLGGCGHELSDRLYRDKVCHFAHRPHTSCHRTATGAASADHLFIRDDLAAWAGRHRLKGRVTSHDLGSGPGDVVDFRVRESRQHVRFQFSRLPHTDWRRTRDRLTRESSTLDWVFGPGTAHPDTVEELYDEHGHVLRFRFETLGAVRRIRLRAEDLRRSTDWVPLEACVMTPDGLVVPGAERRPRRRAPVPAAPLAATPVRRSPEEQVRAVREALADAARLRTRPTWEALARAAGGDLTELSVPSRVRLLVAVERAAGTEGAPVLSALLRTGEGDPPPYLADVVAVLGCGTPATAGVLKRWCQREADRAFAVHGVPSRTAPPRLPLTDDGQIAAPGAEPPQHRTIVHVKGGAVRRPARRQDAEIRHVLVAARQVQDRRRAAYLLKEAERVLPRLPEAQRGRLAEEMRLTGRWLSGLPAPSKPRKKKRAKTAGQGQTRATAKTTPRATPKAKPKGSSLSGARPLPGFENPAAGGRPTQTSRKSRKSKKSPKPATPTKWTPQ